MVRPNQQLLAACPSCGKPLHLARTTAATERAPAFQTLECEICRIVLSQAAPAPTEAAPDQSAASATRAVRTRTG